MQRPYLRPRNSALLADSLSFLKTLLQSLLMFLEMLGSLQSLHSAASSLEFQKPNLKTHLSHHPTTQCIDLTRQCILQNNASYKTMHLTRQCILQDDASYKTMHLTTQCILEDNASYNSNTIHLTTQCIFRDEKRARMTSDALRIDLASLQAANSGTN